MLLISPLLKLQYSRVRVLKYFLFQAAEKELEIKDLQVEQEKLKLKHLKLREQMELDYLKQLYAVKLKKTSEGEGSE